MDQRLQRTECWRSAICAAGIGTALAVTGACSRQPKRKPAAFEPAAAQVRTEDRIAQCNTVHTLTLPDTVRSKYKFAAGPDRAVLSCSLQLNADDVPRNIPASIAGTRTTLTGKTANLDFREVVDAGALSYVAPFDLAGKSEIRFDVTLTDPQTGRSYEVKLRQTQLPGRL